MANKLAIPKTLVDKYVCGSSLSELSRMPEANGISISTIRLRLRELGLLRSHADAIRQAFAAGKIPSRRGIARPPFSDSHRQAMSAARLAWADRHAKGVSHKTNSYSQITRGENKGRGEHRVLMEKVVGRRLTRNECVHHADENKQHNVLDNLSIMTRSDHTRYHALKQRKGDDGRWLKA